MSLAPRGKRASGRAGPPVPAAITVVDPEIIATAVEEFYIGYVPIMKIATRFGGS